MRRIRLFALAIAPMCLLLSAPLMGTAHATHVGCGSVITANTTLDSNVGPCAGHGIVFGADNITLDLNGYTISGTDGVNDLGVGVYVLGHSGGTVKNGTVTKFDAGVAIENGSGNTVTGMTVVDNFPTALVSGDYGDGIALSGSASDNNTVQNNTVNHNGPFDGIGLYGGSSADKITGNLIDTNSITNSNLSDQERGISVENWSWSNTFSNNTVTGTGLDGISLFADTQSDTVSNNKVNNNGFVPTDANHRPGDGIHLFPRSSLHTVSGNTANRNAGNGIKVDGPIPAGVTGGSPVPGSTDNQLPNNKAHNNDRQPTVLITNDVFTLTLHGGITITVNGQTTTIPGPSGNYDMKDGNANCDNNTWSGNSYGTANPTSCIN